jgi:hypothetical protein
MHIIWEMVKTKISVFGPWPHLWGFGQLQRTTVVLKDLAIYLWNGAIFAYSPPTVRFIFKVPELLLVAFLYDMPYISIN